MTGWSVILVNLSRALPELLALFALMLFGPTLRDECDGIDVGHCCQHIVIVLEKGPKKVYQNFSQIKMEFCIHVTPLH